ncbi:Actin cortical patch SUR7/pH-response regulator PalI [Penicillium chrysogenum]|uniref:Actin cortical patch SUR7/pH-response regulator PalI n=1 Tax=Penicillium chrysogenum TaxID=5076 RepID=A0ABQ8WX69_PENCH|nr:Actin cortical patch SUR7/pH-response regulator PalI [Penicillium chrysogenum]
MTAPIRRKKRGTPRNFLDGVDLLTLYTSEGSTDSAALDFYSVHVMSYCQGTLGTTDPGAGVTPNVSNVTECSHRTTLFSFGPTQEWPKVTHGPELKWPRNDKSVHGVLYCMGVGAKGAALIVPVWTAVALDKACFEFWSLVFGSLSMNIASIIAIVTAFEFVALINAPLVGSVYAVP